MGKGPGAGGAGRLGLLVWLEAWVAAGGALKWGLDAWAWGGCPTREICLPWSVGCWMPYQG